MSKKMLLTGLRKYHLLQVKDLHEKLCRYYMQLAEPGGHRNSQNEIGIDDCLNGYYPLNIWIGN